MTDADTADLERKKRSLEKTDELVVDRPMAPRAISIRWRWRLPFDRRPSRTACCVPASAAARRYSRSGGRAVLPDGTPPAQNHPRAGRRSAARVSIGFTDIGADLSARGPRHRAAWSAFDRSAHADLAMVSNDGEATRRARLAAGLWAGRETADFALAAVASWR